MNQRFRNQGNFPRLAGLIRGCVALMFAVAGSSCPLLVAEAEQAQNFSSFAEWCLNKNRISEEARHTVEVLLREAKNSDCNEANQILTNLTYLNLSDNQISNITPLSSLTNLDTLYLDNNQISDVSTLSSLNNLLHLSLKNNKISNLKPLSSLATRSLHFEGNLTQPDEEQQIQQIVNFRSLKKLNNCYDCSLINVDLRGADLIGVDLRGADLSSANLSGAILFYADLSRTNLSGANLEDADLEGVNLRNANLQNANLRNANLTDADFREANLSEANLEGANFTIVFSSCGTTMPNGSIAELRCFPKILYNQTDTGLYRMDVPGD